MVLSRKDNIRKFTAQAYVPVMISSFRYSTITAKICPLTGDGEWAACLFQDNGNCNTYIEGTTRSETSSRAHLDVSGHIERVASVRPMWEATGI